MLEREYIVERIKSLPEESLKEVTDFIEFLEVLQSIFSPFPSYSH